MLILPDHLFDKNAPVRVQINHSHDTDLAVSRAPGMLLGGKPSSVIGK